VKALRETTDVIIVELIVILWAFRAAMRIKRQMKIAGKQSVPSRNATFLFYFFLDATTCDSLVGDLEERYRLIFSMFGKFRADLWYWKETLRSVSPIAWEWFKKLVIKPAVGLGSWMLGHEFLKDSSISEPLKRIVFEWLQKIRG
jgi:hypothetical protein